MTKSRGMASEPPMAAGAPVTEVKVTPEMIRVGMNAYWSEANPGIEDGDFSDRSRVLKAIFIAMLAASTARFFHHE